VRADPEWNAHLNAGSLGYVQDAVSEKQEAGQISHVQAPASANTDPVSAAEDPPRALRRTAPQRSKPSSGAPHGEESGSAVRVLEQLQQLRMLQEAGSTLVSA